MVSWAQVAPLARRARRPAAAFLAAGGAGLALLQRDDAPVEDLSLLSQEALLDMSAPFDAARFESLATEARRAALFYPADDATTAEAWHAAHDGGGAVRFADASPLACFVYTAPPALFGAARQVVVIKGTSTADDVLTNLECSLSDLGGTGWVVHGGFAKVAAGVLEALRPVLDLDGGAELELVGHSLGGAVATLIGLALAAEGSPPASVVAFGCPRIGYAATPAGRALADALPLTRVNTLDDPVPSLPPAFLATTLGGAAPFGHVRDEQLVLCGGTYAFLGSETAAQAARAPARDGCADALVYATEGSFANAAYLRPHSMPVYIAELAGLAAAASRDADAARASDVFLDVVFT